MVSKHCAADGFWRVQEGQEDEEEGAGALSREEALDRAAALARAAPSSTLPALAEAISQRQQQLQQCALTGKPCNFLSNIGCQLVQIQKSGQWKNPSLKFERGGMSTSRVNMHSGPDADPAELWCLPRGPVVCPLVLSS